MIFLLRLTGFLLARLPERLIQALVVVAGTSFFVIARRRRRIVLANLRHAFPGRDDRWIVATGRESVRQMMEFGLLTAALPALNEERLHRIFLKSSASEKLMQEQTAGGRAAIVLAPHLGPQEGLCLLPFLFPGMPPIGGIYRPVNNQTVDTWIHESRERFGVRLFSRKRGLQNAIRLLKTNEWLGLLFDQNSTKQGALITFFDRVASATELPGILAARHDADLLFLYAARRRFWKIELCVEPGPVTKEQDEINLAANLWLERLLKNQPELLPSWLWAHNRWRHQRTPRLFLRSKRNLLETQNAFLGRSEVPRREPFFIRLPDRLSELVWVLPLLRAIRRARPDAEITVIGAKGLLPLVQLCALCEKSVPLPPRGPGYFFAFRQLRRRFPTLQILFNSTLRCDLEAWLTGAPHRFGVGGSGGRRLFLNRAWPAPAGVEGANQTFSLWEAFLRAQGMEVPLDLTPFAFPPLPNPPESGRAVGLFCGGGHLPQKRWPVARWRALIEELLARNPLCSIKLLGTAAESPIAARVKESFPAGRVSDLTGRTSLSELARHVAECRFVVGPDSGGTHLANAGGVPVVLLTGQTDHHEPVFTAGRAVLRSPAADGSIEGISVSQVLAACPPGEVQA